MRLRTIVLFSAVFTLLFTSFALAKDESESPRTRGPVRLAKSSDFDGPIESVLNINAITTFADTKGFFDAVIAGSWNGEYPKGSGVGVIFREGIVWAVKVSDGGALRVRAGGSSQTNGLQGGGEVGYVADPYSAPTGFEDEATAQVWRVRTDWETANLTSDAASFNIIGLADVTSANTDEMRAQYEHDNLHWPADQGAPFDDVDGNGLYDPAVDIPGFPGASQTMWFVSNDLDPDVAAILAGSPSIGLEMQMTVFSFDFPSTNPLGNISFKRVRLIYTGTVGGPADAHIDTMYVTQWSDPDLGSFGDDFVGTDVDLSLGFVYNGNTRDSEYFAIGSPVPAAGFDFLQGPINADGDTLGMSSFTFFGAGSGVDDPDRGVYSGTLQWFNLMEGFLPRPEYPEQVRLLDPITNAETNFWLSGDPVDQSGWVDGLFLPPGDRRMLVTTGPFEMALGDTQDIIIGYVGGIGLDNISSVTVMKFHDKFAQFAFDEGFVLPSPPSGPLVTGVELDGKIVLNWGDDADAIAATEETERSGFVFEGYNVYQLPTSASSLSDGELVATFDLVNAVSTIFDPGIDPASGFVIEQAKQFGTNSGIQRFFSTDRDAIRIRPMSNGVTYFFGVTAYSFLADNIGKPFKTLESSPTILAVTPQSPVPGTVYGNTFGEDITTTHASGTSTARLDVAVIDPGELETADYTVFWKYYNPATGAQFDALGAGDTLPDGNPFPQAWNLTKGGTQVLSNQTLEYAEGAISADGPIIDGAFQLKVFNPPATALQSWNVPVGERWVSGTNFGGAGLFGGLDLGANFFGSTLPEAEITEVQLLFQDQADVDANGYVSEGATYRRDLGYPFSGIGRLPFAAFDMSDPANPRRVNISFVEHEEPDAGFPVANLLWDMGWFGVATDKADMEIATLGGREYIFIHGSDYNGGIDYNDVNWGPAADVSWAIWPASRGRPYLLAEFTMDIIPSIKSTVLSGTGGDLFTFSTTAPKVGDMTAAAEDIKKINIFPNPYYALHELEPSRFDKFVTLSHLPQKADIRIFNLGGQMVRVLAKNDETQFIQWNLQNQNGFPVASGIYIIHIDMPDLGSVKILKLALITEEQILRNY